MNDAEIRERCAQVEQMIWDLIKEEPILVVANCISVIMSKLIHAQGSSEEYKRTAFEAIESHLELLDAHEGRTARINVK